ncbi:tripartite tricarboxylate transporter substrate binding protein [Diaphorobacter sp. LR2014-1]|uniref:Bug family tripartite tricarboxylate transporter substrate binding protein n=1 Tax=Diaphorobacter sp. LR2014-1 TaxID=1933219 RepID=UPI000D4A7725|nr:tripartite tricarboxylate transporter substrate binding protein [Diaphorobacter sp. LR2014-1]POR11522.1 TctC [Diaphorobacter sp. LR2014-1]
MKISHRLSFAALVSTVAIGLHPLSTNATEAFPRKAVTIITSFSAGTGPDAMMRAVGEKLSAKWKQPVVIDNRPGGAGYLAINAVRNTSADGHTLMLHEAISLNALPHLYKTRSFKVLDTFEPVGVLYTTPLMVVVSKDAPWKTLAEMLADARRSPGKLTYGTWGVGTSAHLHTVLLGEQAKVTMLHVPYKEMPQLYTGVSTRETDWAFGGAASTQFVYQSGKARYLAVTTAKRLPAFPDLPTVNETPGLENYVLEGGVVLMAPKGLPAAVRDRINADLREAVVQADIQKRYSTFGFSSSDWSADQLRRDLQEKAVLYQRVIRENNISAE